jgi:hypothetical protein
MQSSVYVRSMWSPALNLLIKPSICKPMRVLYAIHLSRGGLQIFVGSSTSPKGYMQISYEVRYRNSII